MPSETQKNANLQVCVFYRNLDCLQILKGKFKLSITISMQTCVIDKVFL